MTGRLRDSARWKQNEDGTYSPAYAGSQAGSSEGYEDMTKVELQAELESRGLPTSGNKDELIERLEEPA